VICQPPLPRSCQTRRHTNGALSPKHSKRSRSSRRWSRPSATTARNFRVLVMSSLSFQTKVLYPPGSTGCLRAPSASSLGSGRLAPQTVPTSSGSVSSAFAVFSRQSQTAEMGLGPGVGMKNGMPTLATALALISQSRTLDSQKAAVILLPTCTDRLCSVLSFTHNHEEHSGNDDPDTDCRDAVRAQRDDRLVALFDFQKIRRPGAYRERV